MPYIDWYDNGPGSENFKRKAAADRAECRRKAALKEEAEAAAKEAEVDRLRAEVERLTERNAEASDLLDRLEDDVLSLRAIVAKLPKTADGVPVVPGMKLWEINKHNGGIHSFTAFWIGKDDFALSELGRRCHVSCLYSTREAAEKAKS